MRYSYLIIAVLAIFFITSPYTLHATENNLMEDELASGYITVTDEKDNIIFETGRFVEAGDQFINEDNQLYEIISVNGTSAKARTLQKEEVEAFSPLTVDVQTTPSVTIKPYIAIYHTHTDESYIPTDGQSVRTGNGSIIQVGRVLADSLRAYEYEVVHSNALHDPHDANAYHRSRRTAASLMRKNYPAAMFDVHRDSAPLKNYHVVINGQEAAKILLVVGRQSQNRPIIEKFAGNIKAVADNMHPGLIRGIFIARGGYNQDLTPRSMLLEMGTEYNSLEAAQRSASLIADVIPSALTLTNQGANMFNFSSLNPSFNLSGSTQPRPTSNNFSSPAWKFFLVAAAIGLVVYFGFRKYWSRLLRRN